MFFTFFFIESNSYYDVTQVPNGLPNSIYGCKEEYKQSRRTDISEKEAETQPNNTLHSVYICTLYRSSPTYKYQHSSHRHARTTHSNPISNPPTNQPATRTKTNPKHKRTDKSLKTNPIPLHKTVKMVQPRMVSQPPPSSTATNPAKAQL